MIQNWEEYVKKHINIKQGLQIRGYVADDDINKFVEHSIYLVNSIKKELELETFDGMNILDIGCANGRLPIGLDKLGYNIGAYTGIDIMSEPILFCSTAFVKSFKHSFVHLNIANDRYTPQQKGSIDVALPKGYYDLVVCNSLFTHLGKPENADAYLKRIVEATENDNAIFYITWFKSPPEKVNFDAKKSVYLESTIRKMYKDAGLEIVSESGGNRIENVNQWCLVARKG